MEKELRQQFPPPPCIRCGKGMCVIAAKHGGYICPDCNQEYTTDSDCHLLPESLQPVAPLLLLLRLNTSHWIDAMSGAFINGDSTAAIEALYSYKRWLDEVGAPMVDKLRQVVGEETTNPIPRESQIPDTLPKKGEL